MYFSAYTGRDRECLRAHSENTDNNQEHPHNQANQQGTDQLNREHSVNTEQNDDFYSVQLPMILVVSYCCGQPWV